jgi:hypothetical protein
VIGGDLRFFGVFSDLAAAQTPLRVLSPRHGRLVDVTTDYPIHLMAHASSEWALYERREHARFTDGLGALSAWAADECSLGQCDAVWATLARLEANHQMRSPGGWTYGRAFVAKLRRFLVRTGYAR